MGTNQKKFKRTVKQWLLLAVIVAALASGYAYYSKTLAEAKIVTATFSSGNLPPTGPVRLQIAATPGARAKGLMFRKPGDMAADEGMVFVYPVEEEHSFWMKNTYLALDMIFIDHSGMVVGIIENVPPQSEQSRTVGKPSQYVVELLAGQAAKLEIKAGTKVNFSRNLSTTE